MFFFSPQKTCRHITGGKELRNKRGSLSLRRSSRGDCRSDKVGFLFCFCFKHPTTTSIPLKGRPSLNMSEDYTELEEPNSSINIAPGDLHEEQHKAPEIDPIQAEKDKRWVVRKCNCTKLFIYVFYNS